MFRKITKERFNALNNSKLLNLLKSQYKVFSIRTKTEDSVSNKVFDFLNPKSGISNEELLKQEKYLKKINKNKEITEDINTQNINPNNSLNNKFENEKTENKKYEAQIDNSNQNNYLGEWMNFFKPQQKVIPNFDRAVKNIPSADYMEFLQVK